MTPKNPLSRYSVRCVFLSVCFLHLAGLASASEVTWCADETLEGGNYDNVYVEPGTSCTLTGNVVVDGNFSATDATNILIAGPEDIDDPCGPDGLIIRGNVSVKRATEAVEIVDACIERNVTLARNTVTGELTVARSTIGRNLTLSRNEAPTIFAGSFTRGGNVVTGNLSVTRNVADIFIAANNSEVGGNITVSRNDSNEEIGTIGNTVGGNVVYARNVSRDDVLPEFFNAVAENTVSGSMIVSRNTTVDPIQVDENTIARNLICARNTPDPITVDPDSGVGNTVSGVSNCTD